MIPQITLGAVALGTIGYGIKKCFEKEECQDKLIDTAVKSCEWVDEKCDSIIEWLDRYEEQRHVSQNPNDEIKKEVYDFDKLHELKISIYEKSLKKFVELSSQIKRSNHVIHRTKMKFDKENFEISNENNELVQQNIKVYTIALKKFDLLLHNLILKLDSFIEDEKSYLNYTQEQRTMIDDTFLIANTITKLSHTDILDVKNGLCSQKSEEIILESLALLDEMTNKYWNSCFIGMWQRFQNFM